MLWNCAASSAKCGCCHQHPSHSHQEGSGTAAFPPTPATSSTPQQQQQLPEHRLKARSGKTPPHPALTPLSQGQRLLCCEGAESHISQSPLIPESRAERHDSIYWNMDTITSSVPGELPQG